MKTFLRCLFFVVYVAAILLTFFFHSHRAFWPWVAASAVANLCSVAFVAYGVRRLLTDRRAEG